MKKAIEIKRYSLTEFNESDSLTLFELSEFSHAYGEILSKCFSFKLSWESDLLLPKYLVLNDDVLCVGIDQNFAIVNYDNNEIILKLKLNEYFVEIQRLDKFLYVVTELEVITIDISTFKVMKNIFLPDIFEGFDSSDYSIKCVDGTKIQL